MPINKSKNISACKFSFKSEGLSSFDKFFFKMRTFLHFWRAICARTGCRFMMRRKFNYAHFGLIEELKDRFEYLRKVFGRSENLSSFDIMLELRIFGTQFSRLPEVDLRTGNVLKRNFSPAL